VIEFSASDPKYTPENLDRMIEALTRFATRHFTLDDEQPTQNAIGYLITDMMAELFRQKGEPIAGMERTLAQLERDTPDAGAVRYLRALFYANAIGTMPEDRAALRSKEIATLLALARDGSGRYHRKALAALATLHFDEQAYATARDYFKEYLDAYPRSDWAWVAALRIGQSQEALDDLPAAVESYRTAAARYASNPLARVLGHTYAARASEAGSAFDQALSEYRAALEGWDTNYGPRASLYSPNAHAAPGRWQSTDLAAIEMEDLSARISQLRRLTAVPGGLLLERGRWLLSSERSTEGKAVLRDVIKLYPESAAVQEARELLHRSRLFAALDLVDADQPSVDERKALEELAAISREPYSFGVCAANIVRATTLWKRGSMTEAQALMTAALQQCHAQQNRPSGSTPTPLEKDIADIRDLVFRPKGDGVFTGTKWEGDPFSGGATPFLVVNPDTRVTLADGTVENVSPGRPLTSGGGSVLLLNADQQLVLERIITKLGGTKTRQPDSVMAVPNQPAGPSRDVMAFWNRFFRMRPGHWGGWMFSTNPIITGVNFTDAARSSASAHVTIGYEGATVALEKKDGTWRVLGIGGFWIT
jgi:tetratricopeptide (TPR) repeat protein